MIERSGEIETVQRLLRRYPVVGVTGARQVGKTTLARQVAAGWKAPAAHFDLEDPQDLARLADPLLALRELKGLVIAARTRSGLRRAGLDCHGVVLEGAGGSSRRRGAWDLCD